MTTTINVAEQFSPTPMGRYVTDGPFSGERFREEFLRPALRQSGNIVVVLDGVAGVPSSFLEEAFGGLVRKQYVTIDELRRRLKFQASNPGFRYYESAAWTYINEAATSGSVAKAQ